MQPKPHITDIATVTDDRLSAAPDRISDAELMLIAMGGHAKTVTRFPAY
jgi:hypothetical protein